MPYSKIPIPNANILLDIATERHRKSLLYIMTRIKAIKKYTSKRKKICQTGASYLEDYSALYSEFMEQVPEYQAAFQEAVTYDNRLGLIPTLVKPYVLHG